MWCRTGPLRAVVYTHSVCLPRSHVSFLQFSCIFEYDNKFFRRMAYVETNDGQVPDTYPDDYHGGIWKVGQSLVVSQQKKKTTKQIVPATASQSRTFSYF